MRILDRPGVVMKDEISQLFGYLQRLIGSCAEHDITTDIFVGPADPEAYRAALEGVRGCSERIIASGITREQLLSLFMEHGGDYRSMLLGLVEPWDLIPLIVPAFTPVQEELIGAACREWAMATVPDDAESMASQIMSAVQPLALADLLSPLATGMLRFPAIMQLQTAGRGDLEMVRPAWDTGTRILVPATDDRAVFCGQLDLTIFWYLSGKGIIASPCIPEPVLQALYNIGVLRGASIEALAHAFASEGDLVTDLFRAGEGLAREMESITDIRILFRIVLAKFLHTPRPDNESVKDEDFTPSHNKIRQLSGHVLAGFVTARAETSDRTCVDLVLDFIRSVAVRPSGRADPAPGQLRELERNVQEHEQLLRAVTGQYTWRATPMPPGSGGYRPVADLWPDRYLFIYDQEEMAYRSPDASKALVMEALYRHLYGLQPSDCDAKKEDENWYCRIVSVIGVQRAVQTGTLVHPGVTRWLKRLYNEEYDPVNRMVDKSRITRLSLPDQFLEMAVFEGRTGEQAPDTGDASVEHALYVTSQARKEIGTPQLTDDMCLTIINDQIWPVFRQLCTYAQGIAAETGSVSAGGFQRGAPLNMITPRGSAPRVDTTVPSAHHPENSLTGKAIEGKGKSLLDDDGLLVPGGHSGTGTKPTGREATEHNQNAQPEGPGHGTASCPYPADTTGNNGKGGLEPGIQETARRMMEACTKSRELLDELSPAGNIGETENGTNRETLSALRDLAGKINTMAGTIEREVRDSRAMNIPGVNERTQPESSPGRIHEGGKLSEDLLKTIETVKKATCEYRDALKKVERTIESSDSDPGTIQHLTGMTKKAFMDLQQAGTEFQRLSGGPSLTGSERPMVRLPEADDDPDSDRAISATRRGRLEPSFVADTGYTPGVWESLSYFDASFDDGTQAEPEGPLSGRQSSDIAERRFEQNTQALTREATLYLSALRQRTRSDWETIDEKAERVRRVALLESHTVGQDDYATYQRFYQPVAGLTGVARKNIQQALQKTRASRDLNELTTGDDIDEENLAAVRTTMRIFRDRGREPDKTRWCISLLIDASSSMHDETVARKLQATIQTAILFGEAVNRITGIRFEIAAFSDTEYIPLKRYQDDWNIHQGCYLIRQVVQATGGTNDVGAVSSALDRMNRLRMSAGANRMIFVISDGQSGVGGREQMRTILSTNKSTRIFGWGIGPDMEKIEETYRPYGTWVRDISDLPRSMGEVLRRELGRPAMAGWKDDQADPGTDQDVPVVGGGLCTD